MVRPLSLLLVTAIAGCGGRSPPVGSEVLSCAPSDVVTPAAGAPSYVLTDLGPGEPVGIDGCGRIAGFMCTSPGRPCAGAIYHPGAGWSAAPVPGGASYAEAIGIDARGTVALNAWFRDPGIGAPEHRRAYTTPPLRAVPTTGTGAMTSFTNAIHPATGHLVGYDEALGGAFLFDGTAVTPIATRPGASFASGGPSEALAINARDQVVGWMFVGPEPFGFNPRHAFVWSDGALTDLGTAESSCWSAAVGITDAGLVVGWTGVGDRCDLPQVFTWDGAMHVLGCPSGATSCTPVAVNRSDEIVGSATDPRAAVGLSSRGFVHRGGTFYWLDEVTDAPGWRLDRATAVNDSGSIVGQGTRDGEARAFLLTPAR